MSDIRNGDNDNLDPGQQAKAYERPKVKVIVESPKVRVVLADQTKDGT